MVSLNPKALSKADLRSFRNFTKEMPTEFSVLLGLTTQGNEMEVKSDSRKFFLSKMFPLGIGKPFWVMKARDRDLSIAIIVSVDSEKQFNFTEYFFRVSSDMGSTV